MSDNFYARLREGAKKFKRKCSQEELLFVCEFLKSDPALLVHLILSASVIDTECAQTLSEALKVNIFLTHLDLSHCRIDAEGAQAVAEALKINATLTHLNLYTNDIGAEGAKVVAEALKNNRALIHLNVAHNGIGAEGAQAVAAALKINATLTHLDLGSNSMGEKGAQAVAEALKVNQTLSYLRLFRNVLDNRGAKALAEALLVNQALTHLDLGWNHGIGAEGVQAVAEALRLNPTLRNIFWDNAFALYDSLKEKLAPKLHRLDDEDLLAHWRHIRVQSQTAFLLLASRTLGGIPTTSVLNTQVLFDFQVLRTLFMYSGHHFGKSHSLFFLPSTRQKKGRKNILIAEFVHNS